MVIWGWVRQFDSYAGMNIFMTILMFAKLQGFLPTIIWPLSSIWREYFLVNFRWCLGLGILDRTPLKTLKSPVQMVKNAEQGSVSGKKR